MDDSDDIWVRYAPLIKKLYQEERKTLSEVKVTLENDHGFPRTPLSTYETKLRGVCGLRKKLKADDWPRIYHYARAQGLGRYDVFLNGTLIPRTKAWKEIRRSGVTKLVLPIDRQATLPDGVEVRKQSKATPQSPLPDPASHPNPYIRTQIRQSSRRILPTPQPEQMPTSCHSEVRPLMLTPSENVGNTLLSRRVAHQAPSSPGMSQFSLALRSQMSEIQSKDVRQRYLAAKTNLEAIPWNQYRLELQASRLGNKQQIPHECWQFDGHLLAVMPADGFFGNRPDGSPVLVSDTCYPAPGAPPPYFDLYRFLSHIVYLFSNNLHRPGREETIDLMHILANQIPRALIFGIFKSGSLSIWGLWQQLFNTAFRHEATDGLALLIKIVLELHPDWIGDSKDRVLYAAVLVNDVSLVQQVLAKGARPTYCNITGGYPYFFRTVFDVAAKHDNIDCAKLLVDSYDLNNHGGVINFNFSRYLSTDAWSAVSVPIFCLFLLNSMLDLDETDGSQQAGSASRLRAFVNIVALMLEAGADVDVIFITSNQWRQDLYSDMRISSELMPTCLDVCHQWNTSLSELLLRYSWRARVELTRVGVMMAAQQGKESLASYLNSVPAPSDINIDQYLELVLAEQFFAHKLGRQRRIAPINPVARTLIEYGVSVRAPPHDKNRPLRVVVETAAEYGLDENLIFLLRHLIEIGAPLDSDVLSSAVASQGTTLLETLIRSGADVVKHSFILFKAALYRRNEDAIYLLLNLGMDVNSEGRQQPHLESRRSLRSRRELRAYAKRFPRRTVFAHLLTKRNANDVGVWQLLIGKGAKLRLSASNMTCYELLREFIEMDSFGDHLAAFSFVLQFGKEATSLSPSQWHDLLLVATERARRYRSIPVSPSEGFATAIARRCERPILQPILATLILANCEPEFIQELVDSGADINEFSNYFTPLQAAAHMENFELVILLLERGADVKAPARGEEGATALQFVCSWEIRSTASMSRQSHLVRMLVAKGADVNAPANGEDGSTALQHICANHSPVACHKRDFTTRDMETHIHDLFIFLLESGADVNAAPGLRQMTALQHCAQQGRLAESALLIQHGAEPNGDAFVIYTDSETHQKPICSFFSALDFAASAGRLDMTQYLLNVGALSGNPGATGLQGAIDEAVQSNHHAVAQTIRRHVAKLAGHGDINIDMALAQYNHALEERKAMVNEYYELKEERGEGSDEEEIDDGDSDEEDPDDEVDFDIDVYMNLP